MAGENKYDYHERCILDRGRGSRPVTPAIDDGTVLAIFTDKVSCDKASAFEGADSENLLEIRVFNANEEFHAIRSYIGQEFVWRHIKDDEQLPGFEDCTLDDMQFLDIDAKQSAPEEGKYKAIGGGDYRLPLKNAERIKLRNYLRYDDDGMAQIVDFRIVGFLKEGE